MVVTHSKDEELTKLRKEKLEAFNALLPEIKDKIIGLSESDNITSNEATRAIINFLEILAKYTWDACRINEDNSINNARKEEIIEDIKNLQMHYCASN